MGMVLWIKEESVPGDDSTQDLWALYHFASEIDRICKSAGVTELSSFHDNSEMAAEFGEDMDPQLADPADVIRSLTAVRDATSTGEHPFTVDGEDRIQDLRAEIDEAIRVATDCQPRGRRVQLTVVM